MKGVVFMIIILIALFFMLPKRSNMAQFRGKKVSESCPSGWTQLTPEICTRDA